MSKELAFSLDKRDFTIEFYKASGNGGQNRNKRETACRVTHPASGAIGNASEERSQLQNKKKALERCVQSNKFQKWCKIHAAEVSGEIKTPEELRKEADRIIEQDYKEGKILIQ